MLDLLFGRERAGRLGSVAAVKSPRQDVEATRQILEMGGGVPPQFYGDDGVCPPDRLLDLFRRRQDEKNQTVR